MNMDFPKYPKSVYVIFPHDASGQVAGVYVGSSGNAAKRIEIHVRNFHSQTELHDLMRKNGFDWFVIDCIHDSSEKHLEYDWIDFFKKKTCLHLFNAKTLCYQPDWRRLKVVEI